MKMTKEQINDTIQNYLENLTVSQIVEIVLQNVDTKSKKEIIKSAIEDESNIIQDALEWAGIVK